MIVYADNEGAEYPSCPLRTDLNSCRVIKSSKTNDCPKLGDGGEWTVPDYCPLRQGAVVVQFRPASE